MTFNTLGRFCKVLGCQPGDLLIYEDDPEGEATLDPFIGSINTSVQKKRGIKPTLKTAYNRLQFIEAG